jgi:cytoskeletal protein CcmA (bactofilin family)
LKSKNEAVGQDDVTIISAGVMLEGKLNSNGNIRIDGQVNGNVFAKGNVTVGSKGDVNGEIKAGIISLGGKVNGSLIAGEKVTLESTSSLTGDLVSKILVIEEGAFFNGSCKMENEKQLKLQTPNLKSSE